MARKFNLKIVQDEASYSGYSFMSLDEPQSIGIPASKFEVEMWHEIRRLRSVVQNLSEMLKLTPEDEMLRSIAKDTEASSSTTSSSDQPEQEKMCDLSHALHPAIRQGQEEAIGQE